MRNFKLNFTSLKKKKNFSNAFLSYQNEKGDGPFYLLPIIDKNIINTAYQQPTSILTKYISDHAQKLIKTTEEDLKKPIILKNIKKKLRSVPMFKKYSKSKKSLKKIELSRNQTGNTELNNVETENSKAKEEEENKKIDKFYLTAQDSKDFSSKSNTHTNKFLNNNSTDTNFFWNNDYQNRNQNTFYSNGGMMMGYGGMGMVRKYESSMSLDRELTKNKFNHYNSTFRRIRTYQPKIEENWKSLYGLTVTIGSGSSHSPMEGDIEYQSKLLHDQYKLLIENIQYYKVNIITKDNFLESFKCLSLRNKINYNKALEETCGLLLLLPQLILLEFFKYIEKFQNLHIPDRKKFKEKYIFDETSCLIYNHNLLNEVYEYFQNCFEVYLILIKEVEGMALNPKSFENALSAFEKARYDIGFACNAGENAILNYNKDIDAISKFNRIELLKNKLNNTDLSDKIRTFTFAKKNKDRQRKLRIEACLSNKEDENKNNNTIFNKKNKLQNNIKFKSIVDCKLVTKLLKHCKKDAKYQIITQRINNELDESYSFEEKKKKKKQKIIKLNF